ncbi:MAG: amidase [Firmicutes bacterium]|nr:amidase [Bacillota bacterium]
MKEFTLIELIEGLRQNKWTSVDLVHMYLGQIEKYDGYLNSVAELNPDALQIAKELDEERLAKGPRSHLHGIPILIKDNINTKDKMHTTANSLSLADLIAPYEATIVRKLKDAGVIILGKANLSEFAYFMSYDQMPSGYGSRNGQVKSPYHESIDPLGSSTGSAVAVAANLICVAIGTETNGSLMAPAYQNSIVAIKPTFGMVSRYGIIPISETQDTAGPIAKNVADCALLLEVIAGFDDLDPYTKDYKNHLQDIKNAFLKPIINGKIGIIYYSDHTYSAEEKEILEQTRAKFISLGYTVKIIDFEPRKGDWKESLLSLFYEFKNGINAYLKSVSGYTKMTSLKDIIEFNLRDPEKRMKYGQSILVDSQKTTGNFNDEEYIEFRKNLLIEANRLENMMQEENLDALLSTTWASYAPVAGNPSICVPAKPLTDLKPISIIFVGKKWDDAKLISIAHEYEQATKHRIPPQLA